MYCGPNPIRTRNAAACPERADGAPHSQADSLRVLPTTDWGSAEFTERDHAACGWGEHEQFDITALPELPTVRFSILLLRATSAPYQAHL